VYSGGKRQTTVCEVTAKAKNVHQKQMEALKTTEDLEKKCLKKLKTKWHFIFLFDKIQGHINLCTSCAQSKCPLFMTAHTYTAWSRRVHIKQSYSIKGRVHPKMKIRLLFISCRLKPI